MTDYFRDLIARQRGTAEFAEPVMSHPYTGETPATEAVGLIEQHLIDAEEIPAMLARDLGHVAPDNQ